MKRLGEAREGLGVDLARLERTQSVGGWLGGLGDLGGLGVLGKRIGEDSGKLGKPARHRKNSGDSKVDFG